MTLEILTSDDLAPIRHGFFTRKGGASSGVFAGLNCGLGSSDIAEIVAINRARVAEAMGVDLTDLVKVHQVHSADVATIRSAADGGGQADAMVTATPGLGLAILTADCQPVLFADVEAGVIGAAHAGWKGALNGILEATVDAMESLGATRANIAAVIGPSISKPAYEVGPEFMDRFTQQEATAERFFTTAPGQRPHFDLPAYGLDRLRRAGVGRAVWTGHCTYADPERFYSYRRSTHEREADYGRLVSVIRL